MAAIGFDMVAESVVDEDKEELRRQIKGLKEEGDSVSVEYRVCHKSGKILHVMGNVKLVEEDGVLFYQRFLLDCTAQKLQEKENERRHMEMIQALSSEYSLVCFVDLWTGRGMAVREDESGVFGSIFEGEIYATSTNLSTVTIRRCSARNGLPHGLKKSWQRSLCIQ